eukprot:Anaeramoba_ignava/a3965_9.p1 GENE.a3965_9~~a3965_9.p1  ORF type:complete len:643 (+),score=184.66 a3965_9:119-2047(+)
MIFLQTKTQSLFIDIHKLKKNANLVGFLIQEFLQIFPLFANDFQKGMETEIEKEIAKLKYKKLAEKPKKETSKGATKMVEDFNLDSFFAIYQIKRPSFFSLIPKYLQTLFIWIQKKSQKFISEKEKIKYDDNPFSKLTTVDYATKEKITINLRHPDKFHCGTQIQYMIEFSSFFPDECLVVFMSNSRIYISSDMKKMNENTDNIQYPNNPSDNQNKSTIKSNETSKENSNKKSQIINKLSQIYQFLTTDNTEKQKNNNGENLFPNHFQLEGQMMQDESIQTLYSSVFFFLEQNKNDTETKIQTEKSGRYHFSTGNETPAIFVIQKNEPTSESLANDLWKKLTKTKKPVVSLIVDSGSPETDPRSLLAAVYYGRLWRDLDLDILQVACHAPDSNKFNPSHLFLKKWNANLREAIFGEKELCELCKYLQSVKGNPVLETQLFEAISKRLEDLSKDKNKSEKDVQFKHRIDSKNFPYSDYDTVRRFLGMNPSTNNIEPQLTILKKEIQFLFTHMERRGYFLSFKRCNQAQCLHCKKHPNKSKSVENLLKRNSSKMFSPIPSDMYLGHYCTFHEIITNNSLSCYNSPPPSFRTSLLENSISKCPFLNCNYSSFGKDDLVRHEMLFHNDQISEKISETISEKISERD